MPSLQATRHVWVQEVQAFEISLKMSLASLLDKPTARYIVCTFMVLDYCKYLTPKIFSQKDTWLLKIELFNPISRAGDVKEEKPTWKGKDTKCCVMKGPIRFKTILKPFGKSYVEVI